MREVLFLSGKGGTGKTSLAGAFAVLAHGKVLADCDVDAANLHLLLSARTMFEGSFEGGKEAVRDAARCTSCGECRRVCRFQAIDLRFDVDPFLCEGCGACVTACPSEAMALVSKVSGRWLIAATPFGSLASAELLPGEETSGKLVALVKDKARQLAESERVDRVLSDGSPGIGCPVIASIRGATAVILVAEPSLSSLHDLERALDVVRHFGVPAYLVLNKADLCPELADRVEAFAADRGVPLLGRIPYDEQVLACVAEGRSVVEVPTSPAGKAMCGIFERFMDLEARAT